MNTVIREASKSQYLGYCSQRGDVYSTELQEGKYCITAVKEQQETILIIYTIKEEDE